jgi:uncharacterized NAD-dependent epimerase/dehydratase family protein
VKTPKQTGICLTTLKKRHYPALIYCEGEFGKVNGKVTHGLIRNSEKYEILGVIDSTKKGQNTGKVLDNIINGIEIYETLNEGLKFSTEAPIYLIFGIASSGFLNKRDREVVVSAISLGLNIVSGLTEFLSDDKELQSLANTFGVKLIDVRKPPSRKNLHSFSGKILEVKIPVVAVLGTGCATGKRTTAIKLVKELKNEGLNAVFIATGQTGIMQGARYGVAVDMLSSGFASGEIEHAIYTAYTNDQPDIIIVEGQGSLSHPSYTSSHAIIKGALPDAILLQHSPKRQQHGDFSAFLMPHIAEELLLIEQFTGSKVIGITLNHENMDESEVLSTIEEYEKQFQIPATDVLTMTCSKIIKTLYTNFPDLHTPRPAPEPLLS